ncbi:MAG: L-histidine N(alpha)-methyltransferase [Planctomycetota bacterium]
MTMHTFPEQWHTRPLRVLDQLLADGIEASLRHWLERHHLPDWLLYTGTQGSQRWLELSDSSVFTIAEDLTRLLAAQVGELAPRIAQHASLISVGTGSGRKEAHLLAALSRRACRHYIAVDLSPSMLDLAMEAVAQLPLSVQPVLGRSEHLGAVLEGVPAPRLICVLGNHFSNYHADDFLALLEPHLTPEDRLLIDARIIPPQASRVWTERTAAAYSSPANRRFNLGPLVDRGVDPAACTFELALIGPADEPKQPLRTAKSIQIESDQVVQFADGPTHTLPAGELLSMDFTHLHTRSSLRQCFARNGWTIHHEHLSRGGGQMLLLAAPPTQEPA